MLQRRVGIASRSQIVGNLVDHVGVSRILGGICYLDQIFEFFGRYVLQRLTFAWALAGLAGRAAPKQWGPMNFNQGRRSLSQIEKLIPGCFVLLYVIMLAAAFMTRNN